jgi:metallo-beta-lactamase class B
MGAADWDSTLQRPATAAGGVPMRDVTVGTLTGAFGTNGARRDEYIDSQKRIAKAAADAGATVIVSNHSEYDNAYPKARLIGGKREVGENHPFVAGADGVQRYFTATIECATASKLRIGAK